MDDLLLERIRGGWVKDSAYRESQRQPTCWRDAVGLGLEKREFDRMEEAFSSPKITMLFHILALAQQEDRKVLIYSKSLDTLDMIEWHLGHDDWFKGQQKKKGNVKKKKGAITQPVQEKKKAPGFF